MVFGVKLLRPLAATAGAIRFLALRVLQLLAAGCAHLCVCIWFVKHLMYLWRTGLVFVAGYSTKGKFWEWVPASYAKLEQVERKIWDKALRSPFEMTKVARLGTVIVPCTDEAKVKSGNVKNLVMVHGFAGGNAVWAMVRGWRSRSLFVLPVFCCSFTDVANLLL